MQRGLELFEHSRPSLLALAYRMLGDVGRAEDIVQDAWLRWQRRAPDVESPKAYLAKVVTRLCLNELGSARARKEQTRGDRLPEPVSLEDAGLSRIEALDQISMAVVVLLQRLTAAERAVLLLHDVFELDHAEIARLVRKTPVCCRQLLKRARTHVARERSALTVSSEAHERLLMAFLDAASSGSAEKIAALLTEDVVLMIDTGPEGGAYGRVRNLPGPLVGSIKVAAFLGAVAAQGPADLATRRCELNGQPAVLVLRGGAVSTAILLSVVGDRIGAIFMQADPARLRRLAARGDA